MPPGVAPARPAAAAGPTQQVTAAAAAAHSDKWPMWQRAAMEAAGGAGEGAESMERGRVEGRRPLQVGLRVDKFLG
jgi:hypothetical protein